MKGTMMRKIQYLRYVVTVILGGVFLCIAMSGCGLRDSALVIPIGEAEAEEDSGPDDSGGVTSVQNPTVEVQTIYVYVCGAVVNPGVYELPEGSRINAALQAAGGFTEEAGRDYLNLAAKVSDGEKIYFPTAAEAEELERAEEAAQKGLVNINTATVSQLMDLPGIGEARAKDIIAYREENGDFKSAEELMKVPGIKESMYAKLSDRIIVN